MALILEEQEAAEILTMAEGVRLVEESFRPSGEARGGGASPAMKLSGEAGAFRVMAASVPELGGFGLKTLTGIPGRRKREAQLVARGTVRPSFRSTTSAGTKEPSPVLRAYNRAD